MITNLDKFLTNTDLKIGREIDYRKLNTHFLLHYLSFTKNNQDVARKFNKFLHKVKEKHIQDALFLSAVKSDTFYWNKGYIKKAKELDIPDLKAKAKKYFKWSEKEWKENFPLVLKEKFFFCDFFNVESKDRKVLGLKAFKAGRIDKPTIEPKIKSSLEAWL